MFHEVGGLELGIRSADCWQTHDPSIVRGYGEDKKLKTDADAPDTGGYLCEVVITNTGTIHVPVDIELRFADGSTAVPTPHWDDRGNAQPMESAWNPLGYFWNGVHRVGVTVGA